MCDNYNLKYYTDGATTMSRMNLSGYVGHVTILNIHYCVLFSIVGLGLGLRLGLGLDVVSGWKVILRTYL